MNDKIYNQAKTATLELCEKAMLKSGDIMVVGCSSSEVAGGEIGKSSSLETAQAVFSGIYEVLQSKGIVRITGALQRLNGIKFTVGIHITAVKDDFLFLYARQRYRDGFFSIQQNRSLYCFY